MIHRGGLDRNGTGSLQFNGCHEGVSLLGTLSGKIGTCQQSISS